MVGTLRCGCRGLRLQRQLVYRLRTSPIVAQSVIGDTPSSSGRDLSCSGKPVGFGALRKGFKPQPKQTKPALSKASILNGRDKADVLKDTNAEVADKLQPPSSNPDDMWADWKRVDAKVNTYPSERLFTAVGSGGEDFKAAMVQCVVDVVGGPVEVSVRESSGGAYQSVRVGPVVVHNRDQVLAVFVKMREDKRLKFHL